MATPKQMSEDPLFWKDYHIGIWSYVRLNPISAWWPYAFFIPTQHTTTFNTSPREKRTYQATLFTPTKYLNWATPCTGCGQYLARLRDEGTISLCNCQEHILCPKCLAQTPKYIPACVDTGPYVKSARKI